MWNSMGGAFLSVRVLFQELSQMPKNGLNEIPLENETGAANYQSVT